MKFVMPLPEVPPKDREWRYGCWARFYGKPAPPPAERIYRIDFTYDGEELIAEIDKPVISGQPSVVSIYGGDPLVVCLADGNAFSVPTTPATSTPAFSHHSVHDARGRKSGQGMGFLTTSKA